VRGCLGLAQPNRLVSEQHDNGGCRSAGGLPLSCGLIVFSDPLIDLPPVGIDSILAAPLC
jgi:hypothetical protein